MKSSIWIPFMRYTRLLQLDLFREKVFMELTSSTNKDKGKGVLEKKIQKYIFLQMANCVSLTNLLFQNVKNLNFNYVKVL